MQDTNDRIKKQLAASLLNNRMVHAYAFIGGSAEDRMSLGKWLAQSLFCESFGGSPCGECLQCRKFLHGNQEDFILVRKPEDRESIVKDQILELTDRLMLKPFGNRYVVLIEDAQLMNAASQNKLLKTLEEPVSEAVIILLADRAEGLLPTVASRCVCFHLTQGENVYAESAAAAKFAELILKDAEFYKKKAVLYDIIQDKDDSRARAEDFLNALEEEIITRLRESAAGETNVSQADAERLSGALRQTLAARKYIKQLHSVPYTLKQLCLRV